VGEEITGKADVWALGATILHLATGLPPYHNLSMQRLYAQVGPMQSFVTSELTCLTVAVLMEGGAEFLSFSDVHRCTEVTVFMHGAMSSTVQTCAIVVGPYASYDGQYVPRLHDLCLAVTCTMTLDQVAMHS
jgi:serine/threonine protein kinase